MKKGGYKIIDFKGTALSGTAVELPGIYDQIVDDYDKPIMVSGVIISGELQDDAYASVKVSDDSVNLTVYGGIITVTEDDEVTFTVSKTPAELTEEIGDLEDLETTDKDSIVDAINEVVAKNLSMVFVNGTPTTAELQNAELIIAWVLLSGSNSYTPIICHPDNLPFNISNGDLDGTYNVASVTWNKTNGTLTTLENYTIAKTILFVKGE